MSFITCECFRIIKHISGYSSHCWFRKEQFLNSIVLKTFCSRKLKKLIQISFVCKIPNCSGYIVSNCKNSTIQLFSKTFFIVWNCFQKTYFTSILTARTSTNKKWIFWHHFVAAHRSTITHGRSLSWISIVRFFRDWKVSSDGAILLSTHNNQHERWVWFLNGAVLTSYSFTLHTETNTISVKQEWWLNVTVTWRNYHQGGNVLLQSRERNVGEFNKRKTKFLWELNTIDAFGSREFVSCKKVW